MPIQRLTPWFQQGPTLRPSLGPPEAGPVRLAIPGAALVRAAGPASLVLSGCAATPGSGHTPTAALWFASLALVGLAIAGYALGRLTERKARAADLFEARSQHAALWAAVGDAVWRTDAHHRWLGSQSGSAQAPPWFKDAALQPLLAARCGFHGVQVLVCGVEAAGADAASDTLSAATPWILSAQTLLDHEGRFAGHVGTARSAAPARVTDLGSAPVSAPVSAPFAVAPAAADLTARAASAGASENEEADSFSMVVAHDLRAPIRVVDGFTRIVKEDYGHLLDRVANDHLERVLSAAARMNKMIDALLTLARLSNQPLTRQPVNLSQIAHYVMDDLQRAQPSREVDLTIEPGLQVMGDPTLLRLVLENLLGNAWKYSGRTPKAQISLTTVRHGSGRAFVVRDNGAGFDMRSAERLFGVFQRLHSASEFAGHGVGLASARRIVRRHGGDIWAEAEPARGASFTFTLAEN